VALSAAETYRMAAYVFTAFLPTGNVLKNGKNLRQNYFSTILDVRTPTM